MVVGALVFASLSTTAFASNSVNSKKTKIGTHMTEEQVETSNKFLKQHSDLVDRYNKLKDSMNDKAVKTSSSTQSASAVAPAFTDYFTYFVGYQDGEDNYTGEYIDDGQTSTVYDYDGTVYVMTAEIGYGSEGTTQFEGTNLSKYDIITLDFNGDKIVDGFIDIWKVNNVTNGKFSSVSFSTNGLNTNPFFAQINIL